MLRHGLRRQLIERLLTFVRSRTVVAAIDMEIAEVAGEMNFKQKKKVKNWGMLDSFVLAVAMVRGGKVITGDPHFKEMDGVIFIGE
jgi:predicted nucleic acid-binding protein